jgi:monovalent cation/hydrogen antiporter
LGSVDADPDEGEARRFAHRDIHGRAVQAAREVVHAMRANEEIGDDAFHQMEEELDWIEMASGRKDDAEPEG